MVKSAKRKPARHDWKVVEDHEERRKLVDELLSKLRIRVNHAKLLYHGVPEDLAVAAVEFPKTDETDPHQKGWYIVHYDAPRGIIRVVYLFQVINRATHLSIYDAYPIGREQY
jgi:hypothetical protein